LSGARLPVPPSWVLLLIDLHELLQELGPRDTLDKVDASPLPAIATMLAADRLTIIANPAAEIPAESLITISPT
jgi:hypothetical protein